MRYRPFGRSGAAVSSLSLVLDDQPMSDAARAALVYAALESGVNTFELQTLDPNATAAVGQALGAVERRMVFVAFRLGWRRDENGRRVRDLSRDGLVAAIKGFIAQSGLGFIDVALVDATGDEPPPHVIPLLKAAQSARRVRMIGAAGGDAVDPWIATGALDVVATPFSLCSGWRERNRLKQAVSQDIAVLGYGYHPALPKPGQAAEPEAGPSRFGLSRLLRRAAAPPPVEAADGPYAFLDRTPGWTADELCLGYALTEPCLATVQATARDARQVQALSAVVERELPTGLPAQIEMARFSGPDAAGAA